MRHMFIQTFFSRRPTLLPPKKLTFPPESPCTFSTHHVEYHSIIAITKYSRIMDGEGCNLGSLMYLTTIGCYYLYGRLSC